MKIRQKTYRNMLRQHEQFDQMYMEQTLTWSHHLSNINM